MGDNTKQRESGINSRENRDILQRRKNEYIQRNKFSERLGTLMAQERKLFRRKERLVKFKEPILFLQRSNGLLEIYHNVKEQEWIVPNLPAGVEKKIILGRQWQIDIPYASKEFKAYWCHEDWAFPHIWSKPNKLNINAEEAKEVGMPTNWILESANVASESLRDRERKVLIAWERFNTNVSKYDWIAIGKAIGIIALAGIGVMFAWNAWGSKIIVDATPVASTVVENVTRTLVVG